MSVKIAISGISSWLELALLPIRSAFGHSAQRTTSGGSRKVILITPATDGVTMENSVCLGELEACQIAAVELMQENRKIALEGFPLDVVAALCFKHNYRWRFDDCQNKRIRFIIEPGVKSNTPNGSPAPSSDSSASGSE